MSHLDKNYFDKLENRIKFLESILPFEYSLSQLSNMCKKSNNTILKHLKVNYEMGEDFYLKGARIWVKREIVFVIKENYVKN